MTAGRDLYDIHTVLHLLAQWPHLPVTQRYAAHRLKLLYIAETRGWPAVIYYDQQGADEYLDRTPEFWVGFEPPTRAAQQPAKTRGRSATRRGRVSIPSHQGTL